MLLLANVRLEKKNLKMEEDLMSLSKKVELLEKGPEVKRIPGYDSSSANKGYVDYAISDSNKILRHSIEEEYKKTFRIGCSIFVACKLIEWWYFN